MKKIHTEKFPPPREAWHMGLDLGVFEEQFPLPKGRFIFHMEDEKTGEVLHHFEKDNVITLDARILAARLFKDNTEPNHGFNMLAVGTGATGPLLSPDAPTNLQRKLNNEIERKAFASTTFRDSSGVAVAYPTNIVDFTTTYGSSEAVGPLNEMGVLCTISDNPSTKNDNPQSYPNYDPTIDITPYDILGNYLTFSVVTKPNTAVLTLTWRFTF
jgi:hypothetical protein